MKSFEILVCILDWIMKKISELERRISILEDSRKEDDDNA